MADTSDSIPSEPFAPYDPSEQEPWNIAKASHLLRRATFGPTTEKLDAILKSPPREAVDSLLDFDPAYDPFGDMVEKLEGLVNLDSPDNVQRWWVYRMIYSTQPAQEKIALFWHNRFATSAAKVGNGLYMQGMIELFRKQGLGSFRDMLVNVGRDPAMLIWLDGQSNRKGKPNENYAREIMELFTLGIGHYTEHDVQELARAFTGWSIRNGQGFFDPKQFDDGEKEIFGKKDKFDSVSAVDLIMEQPAAPKFLAGKMLREFVHPHPTDEMVDHYAQMLLDEKWQIKPVLKSMLTSRLFYSDWAYRSKIKSPAEIAIGGALAVGGKINMEFVRQSMSRMGQNILYPPNVKGWDGEEAWINANTVLVRFNYGMMLATQREFAKRSDVEAMLHAQGITTPEEVIGYYSKVLLDDSIEPPQRLKFLVYMDRNEKNEYVQFKLNASTVNSKVRGLIHLMMSMPEYQLA
jgi:uncharacterized protein (DUF1800 family)